ncbi:hypothetical protein [Actinoplanes cyaneus]|uniref:hypothetical protein n=1 Tax=Actinoplanes cyaneus TaxID=52696 RepID=UPI00224180FB|nr:hypothetical protein [Actinoplanes cyaneus]
MSTTPPPFTGPKTCDASGMFEIHRTLQQGFDEAVGLVDGVRDGTVTPGTRRRSRPSCT